MKRLAALVRTVWAGLRALGDDDAYERYLAHWRACHQGAAPLDRKDFYIALQERKWHGVRRCC